MINNINKEELQAEIDALHKQADEATLTYRDTIMKIEGALQFAHHLLKQADAEDHKTVEGEVV
jgi:hypothetical protein